MFSTTTAGAVLGSLLVSSACGQYTRLTADQISHIQLHGLRNTSLSGVYFCDNTIFWDSEPIGCFLGSSTQDNRTLTWSQDSSNTTHISVFDKEYAFKFKTNTTVDIYLRRHSTRSFVYFLLLALAAVSANSATQTSAEKTISGRDVLYLVAVIGVIGNTLVSFFSNPPTLPLVTVNFIGHNAAAACFYFLVSISTAVSFLIVVQLLVTNDDICERITNALVKEIIHTLKICFGEDTQTHKRHLEIYFSVLFIVSLGEQLPYTGIHFEGAHSFRSLFWLILVRGTSRILTIFKHREWKICVSTAFFLLHVSTALLWVLPSISTPLNGLHGTNAYLFLVFLYLSTVTFSIKIC